MFTILWFPVTWSFIIGILKNKTNFVHNIQISHNLISQNQSKIKTFVRSILIPHNLISKKIKTTKTTKQNDYERYNRYGAKPHSPTIITWFPLWYNQMSRFKEGLQQGNEHCFLSNSISINRLATGILVRPHQGSLIQRTMQISQWKLFISNVLLFCIY